VNKVVYITVKQAYKSGCIFFTRLYKNVNDLITIVQNGLNWYVAFIMTIDIIYQSIKYSYRLLIGAKIISISLPY
jgi:hypothetical protein